MTLGSTKLITEFSLSNNKIRGNHLEILFLKRESKTNKQKRDRERECTQNPAGKTKVNEKTYRHEGC